jgi:hypothetical protein
MPSIGRLKDAANIKTNPIPQRTLAFIFIFILCINQKKQIKK